MEDFEKYVPLSEISRFSGLTVEMLRVACDKEIHPLPCLRFGVKGGKRMARISAFVTWVEEEERLSVA